MEITSTKHPINKAIISAVRGLNSFSYDRVRMAKDTSNVIITFSGVCFSNGYTRVKAIEKAQSVCPTASAPECQHTMFRVSVPFVAYNPVEEVVVKSEPVPELADSGTLHKVEVDVYSDGKTDVIISTLNTQYGVKVVKNNLKRNLRRFLRTANKVMIRKINIASPYCVATVLVDKKTGAWVIV